jgi:hypothetical protein
MPHRFVLLAGCVLVAALAGCRRDPAAPLAAPDELTLYSIDGRDFEPDQEPNTAEVFYRYPVLGKVSVADPAARQEIVAALKEGMAGKAAPAACFWPRHAVRAVEKGKVIDYVICFECHQLDAYADGRRKSLTTSRGPQAVLNKYLTQAGVPLAPGMAGLEQ